MVVSLCNTCISSRAGSLSLYSTCIVYILQGRLFILYLYSVYPPGQVVYPVPVYPLEPAVQFPRVDRPGSEHGGRADQAGPTQMNLNKNIKTCKNIEKITNYKEHLK